MALDNFIPEIWSGQLLVNLKNDLVYASPQVANRNYEGEVSAFGDTVRINSIGAVTVGDYTKNTNHNPAETLSDNQQVMVIDQAKMFNFQIDDVDAAQQNPKLMGAAMREASFALANVTDGFMSALLNAAVPGAAGTGNRIADVAVSADLAGWAKLYEALVDLGVVLDANNCPTAGRYAVVTPQILGALRKDARFASFGTEANRSLIANGLVGRIADFDILVSNQAPIDSGDATRQVVLAGHNWATTYADQVAEVRAYRPELRFADAVKGLHVYGAKVIRPELVAKAVVDFA